MEGEVSVVTREHERTHQAMGKKRDGGKMGETIRAAATDLFSRSKWTSCPNIYLFMSNIYICFFII